MNQGISITGTTTLVSIAEAYLGHSEMCENAPEQEMLWLIVREAMAVLVGDPSLEIEIYAQCPIRDSRIPPDAQYRADVLVRVGRHELAFELDGKEFHGTQAAFAHDRKRDRDLAALGIETYRFTALEVMQQRERVGREIGQILGRTALRL